MDTRTVVHMLNGRSKLLRTSLRQIYQPDDALNPQPGLETCRSAQKSGGCARHGSFIGLMQSVFEVTELDPLPFVNRRDDQNEIERFSTKTADCTVLVCPHAGHDRLVPERIARMLHAAKTRGRLVDVSMSGIALHLTDELAPGTRVALRVSSRAVNKHVDAAATVLRCRPDRETGWNVVCRFDRKLTFEQIHLIGRNLFASTIV